AGWQAENLGRAAQSPSGWSRCGPDFVDQPDHADAFWKTPFHGGSGPVPDSCAAVLFDHLVGPHTRTIKVDLLAVGEGCDECIDLLLIRTLAPGVDARTCGVADPQHNLLRSLRVMDQHRGRIEGIEIPTSSRGP